MQTGRGIRPSAASSACNSCGRAHKRSALRLPAACVAFVTHSSEGHNTPPGWASGGATHSPRSPSHCGSIPRGSDDSQSSHSARRTAAARLACNRPMHAWMASSRQVVSEHTMSRHRLPSRKPSADRGADEPTVRMRCMRCARHLRCSSRNSAAVRGQAPAFLGLPPPRRTRCAAAAQRAAAPHVVGAHPGSRYPHGSPGGWPVG